MLHVTITQSDQGDILIFEGTPATYGLERHHKQVDDYIEGVCLHCHFYFVLGLEAVMLWTSELRRIDPPL